MVQFFTAFKNLTNAYGGAGALAAATGISRDVIYRAGLDPSPGESGKELSFRLLRNNVLPVVGADDRPEVQIRLYELLRDHVTQPARMHLIFQPNFDLVLDLLQNRIRREFYPSRCSCGEKLIWVSRNMEMIFLCPECQGRKYREHSNGTGGK